MIQRLAQAERQPPEVPSDGAGRVGAVFREELLDYVRTYAALGARALIQYHDKRHSLSLDKEYHSLFGAWKTLRQAAPDFYDFLNHDSERTLESSEQFFYWSEESFGLKPVTSVTHVTIHELPDRVWIASKQIYASHYFDTSLGITLAMDDPTDPKSIYLVYENRSRIDLLGGFFGAIRRSFLRGRLQDGMRKNLRQTVTKLESSCGLSAVLP